MLCDSTGAIIIALIARKFQDQKTGGDPEQEGQPANNSA
jgi:hypothetical protein